MVGLTPSARTLRQADLRFVLADRPTSVTVVGGLDELAEGLERSGMTVLDDDGATELTVAPSSWVSTLSARGIDQLALVGPASARRLRAHGYTVRRVLMLPTVDRPEMAVPLDDLRWACRAVRRRLAGASRPQRLRGVLGVIAMRVTGGRVLGRSVLTVASRHTEPPFAIRAAEAFGVPTDAAWCVLFGRGDELQRIVFVAAERGALEPRWAVKLGRIEGLVDPFDRDQRGLELVTRAGDLLSARAPRLLGRSTVDGLEMSVETAGRGDRLGDQLRRRGRDRLPLVDSVAQWVVDLARTTAGEPTALDEERTRLRSALAGTWGHRIDVEALVDRLPPIRPVLQHNDLGTWNIVADGPDFTVVDWESFNPAGLPLWDLLYFLADASAHIEGHAGPGRWARHVAALLRGETSLSPRVFEWVRTAAAATGVPRDAIGVIVTLGWLHHTTSHLIRAESLNRLAGTTTATAPEILELAELWLRDPALGPRWTTWR